MTVTDKRLIQRMLLRGERPQAELSEEESLPDLAANIEERTEEELNELRETLQTEAELRAERIQRFLSEPSVQEPPRAPIVPIDEDGAEV